MRLLICVFLIIFTRVMSCPMALKRKKEFESVTDQSSHSTVCEPPVKRTCRDASGVVNDSKIARDAAVNDIGRCKKRGTSKGVVEVKISPERTRDRDNKANTVSESSMFHTKGSRNQKSSQNAPTRRDINKPKPDPALKHDRVTFQNISRMKKNPAHFMKSMNNDPKLKVNMKVNHKKVQLKEGNLKKVAVNNITESNVKKSKTATTTKVKTLAMTKITTKSTVREKGRNAKVICDDSMVNKNGVAVKPDQTKQALGNTVLTEIKLAKDEPPEETLQESRSSSLTNHSEQDHSASQTVTSVHTNERSSNILCKDQHKSKIHKNLTSQNFKNSILPKPVANGAVLDRAKPKTEESNVSPAEHNQTEKMGSSEKSCQLQLLSTTERSETESEVKQQSQVTVDRDNSLPEEITSHSAITFHNTEDKAKDSQTNAEKTEELHVNSDQVTPLCRENTAIGDETDEKNSVKSDIHENGDVLPVWTTCKGESEAHVKNTSTLGNDERQSKTGRNAIDGVLSQLKYLTQGGVTVLERSPGDQPALLSLSSLQTDMQDFETRSNPTESQKNTLHDEKANFAGKLLSHDEISDDKTSETYVEELSNTLEKCGESTDCSLTISDHITVDKNDATDQMIQTKCSGVQISKNEDSSQLQSGCSQLQANFLTKQKMDECISSQDNKFSCSNELGTNILCSPAINEENECMSSQLSDTDTEILHSKEMHNSEHSKSNNCVSKLPVDECIFSQLSQDCSKVTFSQQDACEMLHLNNTNNEIERDDCISGQIPLCNISDVFEKGNYDQDSIVSGDISKYENDSCENTVKTNCSTSDCMKSDLTNLDTSIPKACENSSDEATLEKFPGVNIIREHIVSKIEENDSTSHEAKLCVRTDSFDLPKNLLSGTASMTNGRADCEICNDGEESAKGETLNATNDKEPVKFTGHNSNICMTKKEISYAETNELSQCIRNDSVEVRNMDSKEKQTKTNPQVLSGGDDNLVLEVLSSENDKNNTSSVEIIHGEEGPNVDRTETQLMHQKSQSSLMAAIASEINSSTIITEDGEKTSVNSANQLSDSVLKGCVVTISNSTTGEQNKPVAIKAKIMSSDMITVPQEICQVTSKGTETTPTALYGTDSYEGLHKDIVTNNAKSSTPDIKCSDNIGTDGTKVGLIHTGAPNKPDVSTNSEALIRKKSVPEGTFSLKVNRSENNFHVQKNFTSEQILVDICGKQNHSPENKALSDVIHKGSTFFEDNFALHSNRKQVEALKVTCSNPLLCSLTKDDENIEQNMIEKYNTTKEKEEKTKSLKPEVTQWGGIRLEQREAESARTLLELANQLSEHRYLTQPSQIATQSDQPIQLQTTRHTGTESRGTTPGLLTPGNIRAALAELTRKGSKAIMSTRMSE